jgi:anti-sigma B factor antagonist
VREASEGAFVRLEGQLDIETAPLLRARIDDVDWPETVTYLDLGALSFVDSTGIGCLFKLHQRISDIGGIVVARQPSDQLRRLMEVTQLNRLIAVVD